MSASAESRSRRPRLEVFRPPLIGAAAAPEETPAPDPAVEAARREGFEAGRAAGVEEGRALARSEVEAETACAVEAARAEERDAVASREAAQLRAVVDATTAERRSAADRADAAARRAIVAAIHAVAPRLAAEGLAAETARLVGEALSRAAADAEARISVHPSCAEEVRAAIGAGAGDGSWTVVEAPDVPEGAARAEWRDGLAELDMTAAANDALGAAMTAFAGPCAPPSDEDTAVPPGPAEDAPAPPPAADDDGENG